MAKGTPFAIFIGFSRLTSETAETLTSPTACIINVVRYSPYTAVSSPFSASIIAMTRAAEPAMA